MYKMLLDEPPLVVLPSLAVRIGLNEAIVLQQVHYWIQNAQSARRDDNFKQGRWWVYNNYSEWGKAFPFWSGITIKRTFLDLEKQGLLISAQLSPVSTDRTKWYTIDYDVYEKLIEGAASLPSYQNDTVDQIKLIPSNVSKRADASGQIDTVHRVKLNRSYKEAETTAEITTETTADSRARTPEAGDSKSVDSAAAEPDEYTDSLVNEMLTVGVNRSDAKRLATTLPDECRRQLDFLPFMESFKTSKGAYLRSAIEGGFGPPTGWTKAQEVEEKRRLDAERIARSQHRHQAAQVSEEQKRLVAQAERERIERDNPALYQQLTNEAIEMMPTIARKNPAGRVYQTSLIINIDKLIHERKLS